MRIRRKVFATAVILAVTVAMTAALMTYSFQSYRTANDQAQSLAEVGRLAHDLRELAWERSFRQYPRIPRQWQLVTARLDRIITGFDEAGAIDSHAVDRLRRRFGHLLEIGSEVMVESPLAITPAAPVFANQPSRRQILLDELLRNSYALATTSESLRRTARAEADAVLERMALVGVGALGLLTILVVLHILGLLGMTNRLARLARAVRRLPDGGMARREPYAADELGEIQSELDTAQARVQKAERTLEDHIAELARANQDLDQFTSVVSHDLKAAMRGIDFLVDWIEEDVEQNDRTALSQHLEMMRRRIRQLRSMIQDLQDYARAGRNHAALQDVDCQALVESIVQVLDSRDFEFRTPSPMPRLRTYRVPLETILRNLLSNAVKHHDRRQGRIEVAVRQFDDRLEFRIRDDGPGIPPHQRENVFGFGFRLVPKDKVEGSGLGLATVKRLVEIYGGKVWIEDPPEGRGSVVCFTWPALEPGDEVAAEAHAHETA